MITKRFIKKIVFLILMSAKSQNSKSMEADSSLTGRVVSFKVNSYGSEIFGRGIYVGSDQYFSKFIHVLIEGNEGNIGGAGFRYREERHYPLGSVCINGESPMTQSEYRKWVSSECKQKRLPNSKIIFDLGDDPEYIDKKCDESYEN
jgi:hypothetical protein